MGMRSLPPILAEKARVELNEDPIKIEESFVLIKDWLKENPHFNFRTDDQWLVAFLRGCKYRMDQVKAKMELYYTLRSTAPDLYCIKYCDTKVMDIIDAGAVLILPKVKTLGDPKVFILAAGKCEPTKISICEIMAVAAFMYQISFMEDDDLTISGTISLVDIAGMRWRHFTQLSLKLIRNLVLVHQDAVPLRIKAAHFLNTSRIFVTLLNISKIFLTEKLKKRINMHSTLKTFQGYIPTEILPTEYGGTADIRESIDYWKRKIHAYRPFLEEDLLFGIDEAKHRSKAIKPEKKPEINID